MSLWTLPSLAVLTGLVWGALGLAGLAWSAGACLYRPGNRRTGQLPVLGRRLLLAGLPALLALGGREIYLRSFADTTDGLGKMLTTRRWMARHVTPALNADGFRARPFPPLDGAPGRPVPGRVVVLGDSYAFGRGIADTARRLGGRLEARLRALRARQTSLPEPRVWTLARPGWGTRAEIRAWRRYGKRIRPQVVVIAHCLNDIEDHLQRRSPLRGPPRGPIGWLVQHSFAFNDLYWSLELHTNDFLADAALAMLMAPGDPAVWQPHRADLMELFEAIRSLGAEPVLLLIPDPFSLPEKPQPDGAGNPPSEVRRRLTFLAAQQHVTLVDPTPSFLRVGRAAIVLNRNDYHTNELGHDMLAEALLPDVASKLECGDSPR